MGAMYCLWSWLRSPNWSALCTMKMVLPSQRWNSCKTTVELVQPWVYWPEAKITPLGPVVLVFVQALLHKPLTHLWTLYFVFWNHLVDSVSLFHMMLLSLLEWDLLSAFSCVSYKKGWTIKYYFNDQHIQKWVIEWYTAMKAHAQVSPDKVTPPALFIGGDWYRMDTLVYCTRWYCQKAIGDRQNALSAVTDMRSWHSEVAYCTATTFNFTHWHCYQHNYVERYDFMSMTAYNSLLFTIVPSCLW